MYIFIMNFRIRQKKTSIFVDKKQVMRKYTEMEVAIFEVVYIIHSQTQTHTHTHTHRVLNKVAELT